MPPNATSTRAQRKVIEMTDGIMRNNDYEIDGKKGDFINDGSSAKLREELLIRQIFAEDVNSATSRSDSSASRRDFSEADSRALPPVSLVFIDEESDATPEEIAKPSPGSVEVMPTRELKGTRRTRTASTLVQDTRDITGAEQTALTVRTTLQSHDQPGVGTLKPKDLNRIKDDLNKNDRLSADDKIRWRSLRDSLPPLGRNENENILPQLTPKQRLDLSQVARAVLSEKDLSVDSRQFWQNVVSEVVDFESALFRVGDIAAPVGADLERIRRDLNSSSLFTEVQMRHVNRRIDTAKLRALDPKFNTGLSNALRRGHQVAALEGRALGAAIVLAWLWENSGH
jgi:hypothetical protein